MKPDWALLANSSRARLIAREPGKPLVELKTFEHPESRLKGTELVDDEPGHAGVDGSPGGVNYEPRQGARRKEHLRFARELSDHLEEAANQGRFRSIAVFASDPFLGELKAQLGAAATRLMTTTHAVDLTSFPLGELEERIERELTPLAR